MKYLSLPFISLFALSLVACDGSTAPDAGADAEPPLEMSELFGPCVDDSQCPGEGAICRPSTDGFPGGSCTVPCTDRTPCDYRGVYHHCAVRTGATQSFCERRCLNGIDCGRTGYTCFGELPPSGGYCVGVCSSDEDCGGDAVCNVYSGRCGTSPGAGALTGEACTGMEACASGQCIGERDETGAATGWVGGYCTGDCILPTGFNNNNFYAGDTLPAGTCAGNAVCLPGQGGNSRGDLGSCYAACASAADCRSGYTCLKDFQNASGEFSSYTNGACIPDR